MFVFFLATPLFSQVRIVDNAGLLSPQETASLAERIASIASQYDFDLVIVTETNIGASRPMDYADDFFDYNGYGLGQDRDGCLFLLVTGSREYWFSTSGKGIKILNPTAGDKLEADTVKFLKEGDSFEAYRAFLQDWEEFLALDAKGRSYNFFHQWNLVLVCVAWALSLALGFGIVLIWKRGMNTALSQAQAAAYVVPGSLTFMEKKDRFLYSRVTKKARPKQNPSGGIHTGSSGRSHGGRGGRF